MALNSIIPKNSKLAIVGGIFKAVLGDPTIGVYDFTAYNNRSNAAVSLGLPMNPNYLYFFAKMYFSLSIDESVFLSAIEGGSVPSLAVRDSTDRKCIFQSPFLLSRYFDAISIDSYHFNSNENAFLLGDFQAVLSKVSELVGIDTIYAQVGFSVYEITDSRFVSQFKSERL